VHHCLKSLIPKKERKWEKGQIMPELNDAIGESDEWRSWYALSPQNRWIETQKLWDFYQKTGGSLDPEPDYQSPFRTAWLPGAFSTHGRSGVRIIRRVGV
jgi:hypothetical protein